MLVRKTSKMLEVNDDAWYNLFDCINIAGDNFLKFTAASAETFIFASGLGFLGGSLLGGGTFAPCVFPSLLTNIPKGIFYGAFAGVFNGVFQFNDPSDNRVIFGMFKWGTVGAAVGLTANYIKIAQCTLDLNLEIPAKAKAVIYAGSVLYVATQGGLFALRAMTANNQQNQQDQQKQSTPTSRPRIFPR